MSVNQIKWILNKVLNLIDCLEGKVDSKDFYKEFHSESNLLLEKCSKNIIAHKFALAALVATGKAFEHDKEH